MFKLNPEQENEIILRAAEAMCVAARTAPKACGIDNIVTAIITGEEKDTLIAEMERFSVKVEAAFIQRDANNLKAADACVLIGTKLQRLGIPGCDFCGFAGCAENKAAGSRCAYNINDLGIAAGSAVALAADMRVDSRIMYSVGTCAIRLKLLGNDVALAWGIPLSIKGKSPFFDRK